MQDEVLTEGTEARPLYDYGPRSSGETHGVVHTKPHIVELILDLAGYKSERNLAALRLTEPACGTGAFLVAATKRLLASANKHGATFADLSDAIRGYDIDAKHVAISRHAVVRVLREGGASLSEARRLSKRWVRGGDFLLTRTERADFVVGNPPYVRIEQLSQSLQAQYRKRFSSLFDRADLYVAFIERSLDLLTADGTLSFICADRWISNKYGAPLRKKITDGFQLAAYVDLHQASPFESEVVAYPSIFVIRRGSMGTVFVARLASASRSECEELTRSFPQGANAPRHPWLAYDKWFSGADPWVVSSPSHLETLRQLEAHFAPIEASGLTRVRIGVATGNDSVFIIDDRTLVEPDRAVPLVKREDLGRGLIKDAERFVLNTFDPRGRPVELGQYPKLESYLRRHEAEIRRRHVAQVNPAAWFRTIDRVYPELVAEPKLLIPDIAGANEVVFERGRYHPHHNLYFVTSSEWDLEVLGGLLSSKMALFFVWSYAVKMRGGYLRFQAQYLRRIRLPSPASIPNQLAMGLATAFRRRDFATLDDLAAQAYGLSACPAFDFVDTRR